MYTPSTNASSIVKPSANSTLPVHSPGPPNLPNNIAQILPNPTRWTCCICDKTYNIGATSKCLKCSHQFCHILPRTSILAPKAEEEIVTCELEFDSRGWEIFNQWRRSEKHPAIESHDSISHPRDCYSLCRYPSECKSHESKDLGSTYELPGVDMSGTSEMPVLDKKAGSLGIVNIFDEEAEEEWYSAGF